MKLSAYMEDHGLTLTAFAKRAGLNISTAHRAVVGKVVPSPPTMKAIFAATDGMVTPNDFFDANPDGGQAVRGTRGG